jgi:hypothetical protein
MAAGLGFKDFATGEVLTAADVDGYLMQGIWVFASNAARDAAVTAPAEGNFAFTKDTNSLWYYDGAAWVASGATGDIEGVTAGVGISGGGTSGTVTVTNSMATAIDAKGDLIAGTGADTFDKLTVGANNTVLTADSSTTTGLKWAAPAGASFVGCQVYKSAQQTLTNNTETALTFNTERFDTDTFHDTSTNTSRMTIPSGKAGYYLVIATVTFLTNSTPARAVTLRLNGNEYAYLQQLEPVSNGGTITGGSYIINLAVADYIEIFARQESGGNLNVGATDLSTSFTIQYLGA